ncbi:MAG: energy transducer TonB, partial [Gemmatimonadaceae bacterium]|nr:energy transducer TonB [Gemmatimonadaceae bacterium]
TGGLSPLDARALQQASCPLATAPRQLPEVAAIVDVDGLRRALTLDSAVARMPGEVVFSVRFASDGQREWVEVIGHETETNDEARIQRRIEEYLRTQAPTPGPWSVRLHVLPGDPIQFRLPRSQACPVTRIERGVPPPLGSLSAQDLAEIRRAGRYRVGVNVSATGAVLSVEMLQRSGSRIVDDMALELARRGKYRPAVVDGIPVAARYEERSRTRVRPG